MLDFQIYQQMPNEKGTTIYALQRKFQSIFGFTLPLFHGRGLLNCLLTPCACAAIFDFSTLDNLGLMPYRRQIIAVSEWTSSMRAGLEWIRMIDTSGF